MDCHFITLLGLFLFVTNLVREKLEVEVVKDCNYKDCCTAVDGKLDSPVGAGDSFGKVRETQCLDALLSVDTTQCHQVAHIVSVGV